MEAKLPPSAAARPLPAARSLAQRLRESALSIVVIVLVAGVAVALAALAAGRDADRRLRSVDAEVRASNVVREVREHLNENIIVLDAVAGLYSIHPDTRQEGLTTFLRATRLRFRVADSPIVWAPESTAAGAAADASFIVAAVESRAPNGLAGITIGSDLAGDPQWQDALRRSCASGKPSLIRGSPDAPAAGQYVLVRPVRSSPAAPDPRVPCSGVLGFAAGIVNFTAEARHAMDAQHGGGLAIEVVDLAQDAATPILALAEDGAAPLAPAARTVVRSEEIEFGGRRFRVDLTGDLSRMAETPANRAWTAAAAALLAAVAVVGIFLAWLESSRRRVESELKRAAAALRITEQRWQLALEGVGDGVWDLNIATGTAYFSPRYATMLGYAAEALEPTVAQFQGLLHPDDAPRTIGALREFVAGRDPHSAIDFRLRCADGNYRWMSGRGAIVERDADGAARRVIGTNTDIEARMTLTEVARAHESELDAIVTASPEGAVAFAADDTVRSANPAFLEAIGAEASAVVGLPQAEFEALLAQCSVRADDDRGCLSCAGARARAALPPARAGEPARRCASCRVEIVHPRHRVLQRTRVMLASPNLSAIEYFRDVTAQVEVDRIKSEFLATAAHELRTPMTSIYGFSEILATMDFDREQAREFGATIHAQAESLVLLLNELLDLARIEARAGRAFEFAELELADVIRPAIAELRLRGDTRRVDADLGDHAFRVLADKDRLKHAITNVLSNAFKYSFGEGAVTLRLVRRDVGRGSEVGIRVADEGIGMTADQLAHLFERFWRADKSGHVPGTGLGMSLVKETLGYHHGSVEVHSEPGAGTQVVLWLPLLDAPPPAVALTAVASAA